MESSKSNASNTSSAFSLTSHHGTSSIASLANPNSAASIRNHTRQSNISTFPNFSNSSAQQRMSTPPNSSSNFSNKAQRPIRFHGRYPNVFPQKSITKDPNVFPQISITKANTVPNASLSQNFNLFAQQQNFDAFAQQPTPTLGSDSILLNGQQLSETHPHNETSLSFLDELSWKTHVKSELGSWSSNGAFQANMDDKNINNIWVDAMDEKNKRQLYKIGQLDAQYTVGRGSMKHQPPTSKSTDPSYDELRQQLQAREQTSQNSNKDNNSGQQQMTVSNISSAAASGSVIRISMFVVPLCLTVAWILGIQMNLNFKLLNTSSVALAIITLITSIFPLQDGTSHYLKGLVIFLCFIVIGACLF